MAILSQTYQHCHTFPKQEITKTVKIQKGDTENRDDTYGISERLNHIHS